MDGDRHGVNSDQAEFVSLFGEPLGHLLEQMMSTVSRQHDRLPALGDGCAGFALQRDVTDHLTLLVPRHHWNKLAVLDLVPITLRREHLRMHIVVAINLEEAPSDRRGVRLLGQVGL